MNEIRKNNQTGFTIVELLVTIFVFSMMAITTTAILVKAMGIQRDSFSSQFIQENALAVLELMAKDIRVGTISGPDSACIANTLNISVYPPGSSVSVPVIYRHNATLGLIERVYNGDTYYISSNDVTFNSLIFCISNSGVDGKPTRVTVLTSISNRTGKIQTVKLQTTVTSRDVSIEY